MFMTNFLQSSAKTSEPKVRSVFGKNQIQRKISAYSCAEKLWKTGCGKLPFDARLAHNIRKTVSFQAFRIVEKFVNLLELGCEDKSRDCTFLFRLPQDLWFFLFVCLLVFFHSPSQPFSVRQKVKIV